MVVMVIITVMTAFSVPALRSSLFSDQLKLTARRLIGLVSEASQEAVRNQSVYQLNFDLGQNRVWVSGATKEDSGENGSAKTQQVSMPDSVRVVDIASVHGGKQADGTAEMRFSEKGYVDKTVIHLRADDGRDLTLLVSPFVTVTRVIDSYVELEDDRVRF